MHDLLTQVYTTIQKNTLFDKEDSVCVALSGGADSVTLLYALLALKDELGISEISAVHVHHGLRGEEADRDAKFVMDLCALWNIPLSVRYVNVREVANAKHQSLEEAGRNLRYSCFDDIISRNENIKIALAHNADDQVETILFHCIRGTGIRGLAGMPIRRKQFVRPLLECSSSKIRDFCLENDIAFMTDGSNLDRNFSRNRIRLSILPEMQKINPSIQNSLLRLGKIASQEDRYLQDQAVLLANNATRTDGFSIQELVSADPVLTKRALSSIVFDICGVMCEYIQIERMYSILKNGGCFTLPTGVVVSSDGNRLSFSFPITDAREKPTIVGVKCDTEITFGHEVFKVYKCTYEDYLKKLKVHKNVFNFCVTYDMINNNLYLRSRQSSDTIRPYPRGCTKTLKKLYNEWKIPVTVRDQIPVLCDNTGVLAVLGYAVDERGTVVRSKDVLCFEQL